MEAENSPRGTFEDTWAAPGDEQATDRLTLSPSPVDSGADEGPCLYLGPSGQRCDRRALAGGYCANHRPGAIGLPKIALSKRTIAAILAAAGILWPYIVDLVREIIRWVHSH